MNQPKEKSRTPGGTSTQAPPADEQSMEITRLVESARDALSDDMVARLSATLGEGLDLLDRVNRSGLARALPAVSALVENGDLDRIVQLARVLGAAEDALSEEMIGRLAATANDGIDLLDRVNRSGVAKALPAISELVENGDLERIVRLARVVGSMEDAVNDEMISRLAAVFGEGLCLLDRLTRNGGLTRLLDLVLREEVQTAVVRLADAVVAASQEVESQPRPRGGALGLWKIMSRPENQEALQFLGLFGKHLRRSG